MKPNTINKLNDVFELHNWTQDIQNETSLINRAGSLYEMLSSKEQDILLLLLENMEYFSINKYEQLLEKCLVLLRDNNEKKSKYYFTPILSANNRPEIKNIKNDEGTIDINNKILEVKSSMLVAYLLKSNSLQYNKKITQMKMSSLYYYRQKEITNINKKKQLLILVDDFIGSGETALDSVEYFLNRGLKNEKIKVLSLVSLQEGYEKIKSQDIDIYTGNIIEPLPELLKTKGVSDSEMDEIKEIVSNISGKLNVQFDNFGYNDSFSLISMIRTPNNAPSFLWSNNKDNSDKIMFPRFQKG